MATVLLLSVLTALFQPTDDARLGARVVAAIQGETAVRRVAREDLGGVGTGRSDLVLATEVTRALSAALGDRAAGLAVRSEDGRVTLGGRVAEAGDLYRASDVAAAVEGVVSVRNDLVTRRGERLLEAPDDGLGASTSDVFAFVTDDLVGGAGLSVSVHRGVVHVSGLLNSPSAKRALLSAVHGVRGVRAVQTDLAVRPVDKAADLRLASIVSHRLATSATSAPWVGGLELGVQGGLVHLAGPVPDAETRQVIELLVVSLSDVLVVASELTIDPDAEPTSPGRRPRPATSIPR